MQGERARARTGSERSDVAGAAGQITLLALCWYPSETGLRREALEVPAVVNVGSAHSRRGLSHREGEGSSEEERSVTAGAGGVGAQRASDECCTAGRWQPLGATRPHSPPHPRSLLREPGGPKRRHRLL